MPPVRRQSATGQITRYKNRTDHELTTAAAAALALSIWITYRSADRVARMMGPTGSRTVTRLAAFLLLCIGVQILITGVEDVLGPLLARR